MGRKKKYYTEDELKTARRRWVLEHYYRNKEQLNKRRMDKYYELQKNSRTDNRKSKE
jgi:hypothetical protein